MRFIELFGGIGGFRLGLEKASTEYKSVWYNDFDKYAVSVYNHNFGEKYEAKDIRTIQSGSIPDFDLLTAGFPCQAFSIAGKQKGFEDTRGTLFFEIARILEGKRPRYLFLENVKGLLSHDKGKTFKVILQTLWELGYNVEWGVVNSRYFGVPQNRERVFIVGGLRGEPRTQVFPICQDAGEVSGIHEVAHTLDANMGKGVTPEHYFEKGKRNIISSVITTENAHTYGNKVTLRQTKAIYDMEMSKPEIGQAHGVYGVKGNSSPLNVGWQPKIYDDYNNKFTSVVGSIRPNFGNSALRTGVKVYTQHRASEWREKDDSPTLQQAMGTSGNNVPMVLDAGKVRRGKWGDGIHENRTGTLNSSSGRDFVVNALRRLTPVECERLQGFPDNWTKYGKVKGKTVEVSDTQRYKQLGNAVTVNVIEAIGKKLIIQDSSNYNKLKNKYLKIYNNYKDIENKKQSNLKNWC